MARSFKLMAIAALIVGEFAGLLICWGNVATGLIIAGPVLSFTIFGFMALIMSLGWIAESMVDNGAKSKGKSTKSPHL